MVQLVLNTRDATLQTNVDGLWNSCLLDGVFIRFVLSAKFMKIINLIIFSSTTIVSYTLYLFL